ncbi:Sphingomyelin phosphodiesterase 2 [Pleurostoma richardsiae]|uniref:Sphingomyelin phosphodiesterase 2 n=1 Tax=Pleurostoma richardsiae TaxID=41990 RepID=A0AA38RWQ2_9PEZI|nr:Sphingomyelin phosphodiesterase 2 [Pleurostoma richardsiae]
MRCSDCLMKDADCDNGGNSAAASQDKGCWCRNETTELFTPASPPRQLRLQTEPESEQKSPKSSSCQLHLTLTGHDPSRITLADDLGAPPPESANRQPKWDPFERYWSKANSFPDYGRQPPNGTMLSRLKAIIPGYIPINTLSGRAHKDSNDMPPKSAATQTEESDHYPRPKRRKTSHNPGDDIVELEHAPGNSSRARSERRGSPSTASGSNSRTGPGIDEFRRLDGIASPNRKKRPRHKPGGFTSALKPNARLTSIRPTDARLEPIEDSGEDDLAGDGRPQKNKKIRSAMYDTRPHSQNVFRVPSGSESDDQISVQETGSSASKLPTRRTRVATQSLAARRKQTGEDIDASEDELQIKSRPSAPRTRVKPVDLTLSSSDKATVTSRADIKPTEFVKQAGNAPPGGNLRATVTKAFCVPTFVYPESPGAGPDAYDQPCELVVEPEFSRKLIPIGPDGKPIPQLLWLRVTLGNRVQSISYCPSSAILKLRQRIQPSTDGAGALLMIKFASPDVARQVIRWAEQIENYGEANIDLWEIQESELQKTWDNKLNEIIHNKERRPSMPDDVKLLEHNEAARMKRPPGATIAKADPSLPAARSFLRHNMKPGEPSTVEETSFLSDIVEDARLGRRFGRTRAATRSSQPLVREPSPVLVAWTEQNRDWAKDWRVDLCYRRTTISKDDIVRLDEGQFLNDSIITFYLKYLHGKLEEENKALADKVYIFNSFFYEKLTAKKGRGINYEGVQSWTAKTDLLAHDYIVVPINEASHWWVAIICNASAILPSSAVKDEVKIEETLHSRPSGDFASDSLDGGELGGPDESHPKGHTSRLPAVTRTMSHISINSDVDNDGDVEGEVVEDSVNRENAVDLSRSSDAGREESNSDVGATDNIKTSRSSKKRTAPVRKYDPKQPRIVTLDSLGSPHSAVSTNLRAYLMAEIKHKKNIEIEDPGPMGMTVRDIPLQDNFTDCGVYLLGYIREFMKNPDRFASDVLRKTERRIKSSFFGCRVGHTSIQFSKQVI